MKEKDHRLGDYFKRYKQQIMWNAFLKTHDYHLSEDICQDAFVSLLKNINCVPPENVRRWLLVVSEHVFLDYLKKGGQYKTILKDRIDEELIGDVEADPSDILIEKEEKEEQELVLERLKREKPLWYQALMLHYNEHMKDREIAVIMGVKPSLIGKWRERTIEWLRKAYQEEEERRDR